MQVRTHAAPSIAPISELHRRLGWSSSGVAALFLLLDGAPKALQLAPAVEATVQLGYSERLTPGLGLLELACLVVYAVPRTAPLGALLLTGHLGGAVATHVRAGSPLFSVVFPIVLGALLWGGLLLRDRRPRALLAP